MPRLTSLILAAQRVSIGSIVFLDLIMYLGWSRSVVIGLMVWNGLLGSCIVGLCVARRLVETDVQEEPCRI
jgi:hypothetical protein